MRHLAWAIAAAVCAVYGAPAEAHVFGAWGGGFAEGLGHPFGGIDHLLAMIAVGLWAAQIGGRALWAVPAAFVAMMAVGAAVGLAGLPLPAVELGIAGSLLVLGALVALALRLPVALGAAIVGFFALFHGHAHGAELPEAAAPALYALGFVLATAALHGVGLAAGIALARPRTQIMARAGGAAVALAGMALLLAG